MWLLVNRTLANFDNCNDSPIRKPPRFGKRMDESYEVKRSAPCYKRAAVPPVITREDMQSSDKKMRNDRLLELLMMEWMKGKLQNQMPMEWKEWWMCDKIVLSSDITDDSNNKFAFKIYHLMRT